MDGDDVVLDWAELTPAVTNVTVGPDAIATFSVVLKNVSSGRKAAKIPRATPEGPNASKVKVTVSPAQVYIDPGQEITLTVTVEQLETVPSGESVEIRLVVE